MIRRTLFLILLCGSLQAYIYNDSLLIIYSKVVPRIMALDNTQRGGIQKRRLCILYEKGDAPVAEKLREQMLQNLPSRLKNGFSVEIGPYEETGSAECAGSTALMLLDARPEKIERALKLAERERLLTFSYSNSLLERGAAVSLMVGKEVYPVINIEAVKRSALKLDAALFQIARIYDGSKIR